MATLNLKNIQKIYPHSNDQKKAKKKKGEPEKKTNLQVTDQGVIAVQSFFSFIIGDIDIRRFGSQGQQRTAALSLKLSEIELVKKIAKDAPILLLDDVLSELDSNRQNYLLGSIGDIQTIITCTGLDEFVKHRFEINKVYQVSEGTVACMNGV